VPIPAFPAQYISLSAPFMNRYETKNKINLTGSGHGATFEQKALVTEAANRVALTIAEFEQSTSILYPSTGMLQRWADGIQPLEQGSSSRPSPRGGGGGLDPTGREAVTRSLRESDFPAIQAIGHVHPVSTPFQRHFGPISTPC